VRLRATDRRGTTPGDVLIGLAALSLIAALLYPSIRGRSFRSVVDTAVIDVEEMRSGARGAFSRTGSWPPPSTIVRDAFSLRWGRWETVERVPAPPSVSALPPDADAPPDSVGPALIDVVSEVGSIVVTSGNDGLLAELLIHFGDRISFVRDTTWTLVVRENDAPGGPGS